LDETVISGKYFGTFSSALKK